MNKKLSSTDGYDFSPNFNEEQSYALGLLWADGWMGQTKGYRAKHLRIEVLEEDFQDFKSALSSIGKLTETVRLRKDRKKAVISALISNKALCEWLFENGFKNKSVQSPINILSHINKQYHKDFIRGWIDGDGCFYVNEKNNCFQFCMAGSYEQDWISFIKILNILKIKYTYKKKTQIQKEKVNKYSIIRITGLNNLKIFIDYVYKDANFFLKRKYEKAFIIKNRKLKIIKNIQQSQVCQ